MTSSPTQLSYHDIITNTTLKAFMRECLVSGDDTWWRMSSLCRSRFVQAASISTGIPTYAHRAHPPSRWSRARFTSRSLKFFYPNESISNEWYMIDVPIPVLVTTRLMWCTVGIIKNKYSYHLLTAQRMRFIVDDIVLYTVGYFNVYNKKTHKPSNTYITKINIVNELHDEEHHNPSQRSKWHRWPSGVICSHIMWHF